MKFSAPSVLTLLSFGISVSALLTSSSTVKSSSTTTATTVSTVKSSTTATTLSTVKSSTTSTSVSTASTATTTTSLVATVVSTLTGTVTGISGTVGSAVGNVSALLSGNCNAAYTNCTVVITGEIENILTDGTNWTGKASVSGWMQNGHAYGSLAASGSSALAVPLSVTCNSTANVCTGTLSGNVTQAFANGGEIEGWGWLTPAGYCSVGRCVGSITLLGDPGYKAKLVRSVKRVFDGIF